MPLKTERKHGRLKEKKPFSLLFMLSVFCSVSPCHLALKEIIEKIQHVHNYASYHPHPSVADLEKHCNSELNQIDALLIDEGDE